MLNNKVALVTGAASGIGRALALAYQREGATVVVADMNGEGGRETVALVEKQGGSALFVPLDAADPASHEAVVAATLARYGRLDIACNNAGMAGGRAPAGEYPVDTWKRVIDVNLSGVFYGMRAQLPVMQKAGSGAIVNLASILGQVAMAGTIAYTASNPGVIGMTKVAALDYAGHGIRVNAVGPGFIRTPMIGGVTADEVSEAQITSLHPIGRLGKPEEVAELLLWLTSPRASFVTGAYYPVDGGYLAR